MLFRTAWKSIQVWEKQRDNFTQKYLIEIASTPTLMTLKLVNSVISISSTLGGGSQIRHNCWVRVLRVPCDSYLI